MYSDYFGFERPPFRITPDTDLFFTGGRRGEILDALVYAITNGEGMVKVVGEVGTGKTMLCRMLELRVPAQVEIVYLANPSLSPEDILHAIALEMELAVDPAAGRLQVMHALHQRLLAKHARGLRVVVLVEEAQGMPIATLEEIRLLSNLETHRDKLLQIVLFGQPELDRNLAGPEIRQLRERITHGFRLEPLTAPEVREYVEYRLRAAGYRGSTVFRRGALAALARGSEGLTRRVNILADKALLAAYANDTHDVARRHVMTAIADSEFRPRRRVHVPEAAMTVGLGLLAGIFLLLLLTREPLWRPAPAVAATRSLPAADAPGASAAVTVATEVGTTDRSAGPGSQASAVPQAAPPVPGPAPVVTPAVVTPAAPPQVAVAARADVESAADEARSSAPEPAVAVESATPGPPAAAAPPVAAVEVSAPVVTAPTAAPASVAPGVASSADGVPATEGDLVDRRLVAAREWLDSAPAGHYSIQILITDADHRRNLIDFLATRERNGEIEHIYVYQTRRAGSLWYGVLYGIYASFSDARAALDQLPPQLSRYRPFIRNIGDVAGRA